MPSQKLLQALSLRNTSIQMLLSGGVKSEMELSYCKKCVVYCPYRYPAKSTHYKPLKNDSSLILKTC